MAREFTLEAEDDALIARSSEFKGGSGTKVGLTADEDMSAEEEEEVPAGAETLNLNFVLTDGSGLLVKAGSDSVIRGGRDCRVDRGLTPLDLLDVWSRAIGLADRLEPAKEGSLQMEYRGLFSKVPIR